MMNFLERAKRFTLQKTSKLKRLARHLLTTTCLTVGGAAIAHASVLDVTGLIPSTTEGSPTVEVVSPGTTGNTVSGTISGFGDAYWIEFEGLPGGSTLSAIDFVFDDTSGSGIFLAILSSSDLTLSEPDNVGAGYTDTPSVTIPGNGDIVVYQQSSSYASSTYTITLNDPASGVPEPATLGVMGLGLAGIGALGRRAKQS